MSYRELENPMVIDSLWRHDSHNDHYFNDVIDMDEFEECRCCSCGELLEREWAIESEKDDVWLCEDPECAEKHYTGWAIRSENWGFFRRQYLRKNKKAFTGQVNTFSRAYKKF